MTWGSPAEIETRRRMILLYAAFGYERMNISLMTDPEFDAMCLEVDLSIDTGYPKWDAWWREHFDPSTGQWVHKHPYPAGLEKKVRQIAAYKGIAIHLDEAA